MSRKLTLIALVLVLGLIAAMPIFAKGPKPHKNADATVYVISQGLYYDTNISGATNLPPHGPFQQLFVDENGYHLSTEFGPGDQGHHGGRWWVDANDNGEMDEGDAFFSCPLLGPGRTAP
ncbi:MAG: hypothetical protein GY759_18395 [Chloroflexi bacterium]|nr:hypothetical protein [Chloroflexota bacterium]